ncbi:hypothetical protein [Halorussus halobius]|uniref:hypothetical protein n=1 Tax=Halorussus halobius TaxID=1710537 RepID=UPI001091CA9D|nr:hypothetical protein [Halorussus halobius]
MIAEGVVFVVLTVLLVAASLALLVPVVRNDYAVLYRRGVLYFSLSLLFFAGGTVVEDLVYFDVATDPVVTSIYSLLYVVSGWLHLRSVWLFARGFIVFEDRDVFQVPADGEGGFEDAD